MANDSHFKFRLYIAGNGPHSTQAIVNLNALCDEYLPDRHEIEVVDVLVDQRRALAEGVMLTPLLVKLSPEPVLKILGTLSMADSVLAALGLARPSR
jgi:circadian clock protein KaiB